MELVSPLLPFSLASDHPCSPNVNALVFVQKIEQTQPPV